MMKKITNRLLPVVALLCMAVTAQAQTTSPYDGVTISYTGYYDNQRHENVPITEVATDPNHILALVAEIYTNPAIPGRKVHQDYNTDGTIKGTPITIDYNAYSYKSATYTETNRVPWITGYIGATTQVSNPTTEGLTVLFVEVKDTWKCTSTGNANTQLSGLTPAQVLDKTVKSMRIITGTMRVSDEAHGGDNPGYIFTMGEVTTNRFFFISKGRTRRAGDHYTPFWDTFEEISPTTGSGATVTADLAKDLNNAAVYGCIHDCPFPPRIETGHEFTLSTAGESSALTNLSIFIPDKRYYTNGGSYLTGTKYAPKVFLYKATLNADSSPSEDTTDDGVQLYDVTLDWSTWFNGEKIQTSATEQYYVYIVDADGNYIPLIVDEDGNAKPISDTEYHYQVEQGAEAQTITYIVTANPIELDANGNIVNTSSILVNTNTGSVTIPGGHAFFTEAAGYRSRYDVTAQKNVYKNTVTVGPNTDADYSIINCSTDYYRLYRHATGSETFTPVAYLTFTKKANGTYDYRVRYDDATQDLDLLFDATKPVLTGNVGRTGKVTFVDRFTASTATNDQPQGYEYLLGYVDDGKIGEVSNGYNVPVHKTTNTAAIVGVTHAEADADTHHLAQQNGNVGITFTAGIDQGQTITDYAAHRVVDYADIVGKAEHTSNDNFSLIGLGTNGNLSEDLGTYAVGGGTDLTVFDNSRFVDNTAQQYVPVVTTLVNDAVDGRVNNSYGCEFAEVDLPQLTFTCRPTSNAATSDVLKTEPFAGETGRVMAYGAKLHLTPSLPASIGRVYLYRIWRVEEDGTEVLLNDVNAKDYETEFTTYQTGWEPSYEMLRDNDYIDPAHELVIADVYIDKMLTGTKTVEYIARMYSTNDGVFSLNGAPAHHAPAEKPYYITEKRLTVTYNNQVVTGLDHIAAASAAAEVTYYNLLGTPASTPWPGMNVVVTRHAGGSITTTKAVY